MNRFAAALALTLAFAQPAFAVNPDEMLKDPAMENRAREISKDLRCLVCQNQSIDDSDAPLAKDLRVIVRERLSAGDSNDQVITYVTNRYGDYVLLNPPFKAKTFALWFGPALIFSAALLGVFVFYRRRKAATGPAPLSAEEKRRLEALLKDEGK